MLVVAGDIDISVADRLEAAVDDAIANDGHLELDLRDTTFMDCAGLAVLVAAYQRLGRNQEAIVIREPSPATANR